MVTPHSFPPPPAHRFARRTVWHTIGIVLAAVAAALVFYAYRQPAFIVDFVNMTLC